MYAALIHTNDRSGGNNRYVGNIKADTVGDLANKLAEKYPQAEAEVAESKLKARWYKKLARDVRRGKV
jgi:hypothetical protein